MFMYILLLFALFSVKCSSLGCYSNYDCGDGYCCRRQHITYEGRCFASGCIGQVCRTNRDCGDLNECCRNNTCAACSDPGCKNNSECSFGEYCCRRKRHSICSDSCEGQICKTNDDCGAPGECCVQNKCTSSGCRCLSNANCKLGEYCCSSDTGRTCNSSCIGRSCFFDSDCGGPGEDCTYPDRDCVFSHYGKKCPELPEFKCFNKNGCYSHKDCNVFGSGYYCCGRKYSIFGKSCNSNCLKKYCDKDGDCGGSSECCDSSNECVKCPNNIPAWLIGTTVGISLLVLAVFVVVMRYVYKKKRQGMESQASGVGETHIYENIYPQSSRSATLQSSAGSSFVDDVQSFRQTQPAGTTAPLQNYAMSSRMVHNEPEIMSSNSSPEGYRSEVNEIVLPSAPTTPYLLPSVPTHPYPVAPPPYPPPSYKNLFGNR